MHDDLDTTPGATKMNFPGLSLDLGPTSTYNVLTCNGISYTNTIHTTKFSIQSKLTYSEIFKMTYCVFQLTPKELLSFSFRECTEQVIS